MIKNRLIYLLGLTVSAVLFVIHGAWFYWIMLLAMLTLPFVSLLFSLPSMLTFQLQFFMPAEAIRKTELHLRFTASCTKWIPCPAFRFRLCITEQMTGKRQKVTFRADTAERAFSFLPMHCGVYKASAVKCRVLDALGLWSIPRKAQRKEQQTLVMPQPTAPLNTAFLQKLQPVSFQPKPGGGYSEIHDHREYRPGDSVRQIRWKLSCKNDKLIVREPLIPVQQIVVAVQPAADAEALDSTLEQLAWISQYLSDNELSHTVFWRSGDSILHETVKMQADVQRMLSKAVLAVPTPEQELPLDSCPGAQVIFLNGKESGAQI